MLASALALLLLGAPPTLPPPPPPAAPQATLAFAVDKVKNATGTLVIAVYDSQAAWLDLARAVKVLKLPARTGTVYALMEGLPVGPCAVVVFHDENGNGKLDMGWFPLPGPTEGIGTSSGAARRMGAPRYDEARFDCRPGEAVVKVTLSY